MFSPRAEYCPIPGRLRASSRSRWTKRPVRAIWPDQSLASFARSSLQASWARPRALRSALARLNRSRAIASAVVDGRAGAVCTGAGLSGAFGAGRGPPPTGAAGLDADAGGVARANSTVTQRQLLLTVPSLMPFWVGERIWAR